MANVTKIKFQYFKPLEKGTTGHTGDGKRKAGTGGHGPAGTRSQGRGGTDRGGGALVARGGEGVGPGERCTPPPTSGSGGAWTPRPTGSGELRTADLSL